MHAFPSDGDEFFSLVASGYVILSVILTNKNHQPLVDGRPLEASSEAVSSEDSRLGAQSCKRNFNVEKKSGKHTQPNKMFHSCKLAIGSSAESSPVLFLVVSD